MGPDIAACMQVHRDVQPSNLVWSDSVNRWRLTGCQSWARKGSDAALSYSLRYAAPEVSGHATMLTPGTHMLLSGQEHQSEAGAIKMCCNLANSTQRSAL